MTLLNLSLAFALKTSFCLFVCLMFHLTSDWKPLSQCTPALRAAWAWCRTSRALLRLSPGPEAGDVLRSCSGLSMTLCESRGPALLAPRQALLRSGLASVWWWLLGTVVSHQGLWLRPLLSALMSVLPKGGCSPFL